MTLTLTQPGNETLFHFQRERADLTYILESSDDLRLWCHIINNPGAVGSSVTMAQPIPLGVNWQFLRLRVY